MPRGQEAHKLLANPVRAVEKSREHWRTVADERQRRIAELEAEVAEQKTPPAEPAPPLASGTATE